MRQRPCCSGTLTRSNNNGCRHRNRKCSAEVGIIRDAPGAASGPVQQEKNAEPIFLSYYKVKSKLVKRLKIVQTFSQAQKNDSDPNESPLATHSLLTLTSLPQPPNLHFLTYANKPGNKMAGVLKVAAFFGICTALVAVLIAWCLKENFDPESVKGKKVVICGASTGIGEELAYQYAKLGAQLLLVAWREEALKKVVARCGELGAQTANYVVADLSSLEAAKHLAAVSNKQLCTQTPSV